MKSTNNLKTVLLFAIVFLGIHTDANAAYWNASYYAAVPVWNVDYSGSQTVIWSSAGTGVDDPVWESTSGGDVATFSVSSKDMLTHVSTNELSHAELFYGWSVHTILELNGLPPGETAQVSIAGSFEATTKSMVYKHLAPSFPFEYAEAWVQIGGNLTANAGGYTDQRIDYNVNSLDAENFCCSSSSGYEPPEDWLETSDYHNNADFDLFGGNAFTASNGFTVDLVSDFYISSYVDGGTYVNTAPTVRAVAEGYGNEFSWAVTAAMSSPVPIPGAVWLMASGLIGLAGLEMRFKTNFGVRNKLCKLWGQSKNCKPKKWYDSLTA